MEIEQNDVKKLQEILNRFEMVAEVVMEVLGVYGKHLEMQLVMYKIVVALYLEMDVCRVRLAVEVVDQGNLEMLDVEDQCERVLLV